jgi:hypothetical protein
MALISKKTPEQRAIEAGIKEQEREVQQKQREEAEAERQVRERAQRREQVRSAFFATPAGQARLAFEREDHAFQYSIDAMKTADPVATLNSVCNEGNATKRAHSQEVSRSLDKAEVTGSSPVIAHWSPAGLPGVSRSC